MSWNLTKVAELKSAGSPSLTTARTSWAARVGETTEKYRETAKSRDTFISMGAGRTSEYLRLSPAVGGETRLEPGESRQRGCGALQDCPKSRCCCGGSDEGSQVQ